MKLYIIRHGQTDWNVEGKIQGRQDIPLNDMGRRQARALADGMKSRPVASVYSSPQKRAMETAEAIAGPLGLTVKAVPQLMEIGYGDWEGRSAEDILTTDRELYESWWQHPATVAPPGGETLNQVDERCRQAWDMIRSGMKGDTAVVAHGGTPTLSYIFWRASPRPRRLWSAMQVLPPWTMTRNPGPAAWWT